MSTKQKHSNSFRGGMRAGIDMAQQNSNTYQRSLNGRVIFNPDGTWAWENTKGTKIVFQLNADYGAGVGYEVIGSDYVSGTLVIHSTNDVNSEIGIVSQDKFGVYVYKTAYNDAHDPNGDKLAYSKQYNIVSDSVEENLAIKRSYWNDNKNEPRVFNFVAGADFNYAPPYPVWYSAHGIAQMPDLTWGLFKYRRNVLGKLKSGKRQYFYRYVHQTGYVSPWSIGSGFIMMAATNVDPLDWTKYEMGASGVFTSKGHELELKYLDQRFQQVQVAALYWETDAGAKEASIIFTGDITGPDIVFEHVSDVGEIVNIEELTQRFFNIKSAKTQGIHRDNYYHMGNIKLYGDIPVDTLNISAQPVIRKMLSDTKSEVATLPLTHQNPVNDTVTKRLFSGPGGNMDEQYIIANDYINYKGTQWQNLFTGDFRQDTYMWALVLFNRKGQSLFAQHITDYTMPKQYNNEFTDARNTGAPPVVGNVGAVGDYVLTDYSPGSVTPITDNIVQGDNVVINIMGMKFGNINLTNVLFDANGKLQLSGFAIVRMDRLGVVQAQGLLCNTTRRSSGGDNYTDETRPLPTSYNYLVDASVGVGTASTIGINWKNGGCNEQELNPRGFWHTFEAPDYFIDPQLFANSSISDKVELVGGCYPAFRSPGFEDDSKELAGGHGHFYGKNYHTPVGGWDSILDALNPTGVSNFGNQYQVGKLFANARNIANIEGSLSWTEYSSIAKYLSLSAFQYFDVACAKNQYSPFNAIAHKFTLLLSIALNTCSLKNGAHHCAHYIANYLRPVSPSAVTSSLLENRVYHNIGHFVPINAVTLAAAHDGAGNYIFNDVEVWGGDCYTDYFGYSRLVPYFGFPDPDGNGADHIGECGHSPDQQDGAKPDYSIGLIFPIESKFNHTMRSGDSYPKVGTLPMATYCGDDNVFGDGIYYITDDEEKQEDFAVNKVLQAQDLISQYNAKKKTLNKEVNDYPLMEIYAGAKFYGEEYDAYRRFLVNNKQFAQGQYGEIVCIEDFFDGQLYMFQRNAFSKIRFNERELVNTETGNITTGTGAGYQGHDYISTVNGTQHQFSMVNTGKAIYVVDSEDGKLMRFAQDGFKPISDVDDARWIGDKAREYWYVDGFDNNFYDNPSYLGGIHGVYDSENSGVIYTFTKRRENGSPALVGEAVTVEYCEINSAFATYHGFMPRWYMKMKQSYLSMEPDFVAKDIYAHEEGVRGSIYRSNQISQLKFIPNPIPKQAKVFDNGKLSVMGDVGIVRQVTARTEITGLQTVILNDPLADDRPSYREGFLTYPIMQKDQRERERGKYLELEFTINNDGSDKFVRITEHETIYRLSSPV